MTELVNLIRFGCLTVSEFDGQMCYSSRPSYDLPCLYQCHDNQENGCAPSEDSNQPGHTHSVIRAFAERSEGN